MSPAPRVIHGRRSACLSVVAPLVCTAVGCGTGSANEGDRVQPAAVASDSVTAPAEPPATDTSQASADPGADVRCPDAVEGTGSVWSCSMHPHLHLDAPGTCPICGMDLVERRAADVMTDAPPPDVDTVPDYAFRTSSGLATCVVRAGREGGRRPSPSDTVTVSYVGWTTDGDAFDSSMSRGRPATFPLQNLIRGWVEGIPLMVEGEVRRLWIPAGLAYGDGGGGRPAGMLVFDIELLSIDGP